MMGFQYIPDDETKYIYLYHPDFPTAKRVRRYGPDGPTGGKSDEYIGLERQGWTTSRFAQTLYHETNEPMTVTRPEEVRRLIEEGWSERPTAKGPVVHPHANDVHRQRFLANQRPRKEREAKTA